MNIGTYFGIAHRISFGFIFLISFATFASISINDYTILARLVAIFGFVLLHEYGHIYTCLWQNGEVDYVELNFLGGVAYIRYDKRNALAELPIILVGPLVNVLLAWIFFVLSVFVKLLSMYIFDAVGSDIGWLLDSFIYCCHINLILVAFNLLPIFPMDGGRILRATTYLINKDFIKATKIATYTSIIVAAIVFVLSLFFYFNVMLLAILIIIPLAGWWEYKAEVEAEEYNETFKAIEEKIAKEFGPTHYELRGNEVICTLNNKSVVKFDADFGIILMDDRDFSTKESKEIKRLYNIWLAA